MSCKIPELLLYMPYETINDYENRILVSFISSYDIIDKKFILNGKEIKFRHNPIVDGKPEVFRHITTTENGATNRVLDVDRCSKITWAEHVLLNCFSNKSNICRRAWIRENTSRIHIWCLSLDYIVVLEERDSYILFITAYPVTRTHTKSKLNNEYLNCAIEFLI